MATGNGVGGCRTHSDPEDPGHADNTRSFPIVSSDISDKSRSVTLLLAFLLGPFGAHRFYTGHTRSGIWMAVTLGGLGIWYLYDLIIVAAGGFRDAEGRLVLEWDLEAEGRPALSEDVLQELDLLRREVAELSERADFTERLLANTKRQELDDPDRRPGEGPLR
jgi:hypothetical protein